MMHHRAVEIGALIRSGALGDHLNHLIPHALPPRAENSSPTASIEEETEGNDDITKVVITIQDNLERASAHNSVPLISYSIFGVPSNMREVHRGGFDPNVVSIGPLHRDQPHLKAMEDHKYRFLLRLLGSKNNIALGVHTIEVLAVKMKGLEAAARGCYMETFNNIDSAEFVLMMILDGCFVVELLRLYAKSHHKEHVVDPIFNMTWILPNLQRDLVLLENQLPFIVLETIFQLTRSSMDVCSLEELALHFFNHLMPRKKEMLYKYKFDVKPKHLLDLFRSSFLSFVKVDGDDKPNLPPNKDKKSSANKTETVERPVEWLFTTNVAELTVAGVKFRSKTNHDLLDVAFQNGALEIPDLLIDDYTYSLFLNFIAYEGGFNRHQLKPYFTYYVVFLHGLIKSSLDVKLLNRNGIICHTLECNEDVPDLFKKLCKNLVYDDQSYLSEPLRHMMTKLTKWQKFKAKWLEEYYNKEFYDKPWAEVSFAAAIILLVLTFIQTFFAVFSYGLPR